MSNGSGESRRRVLKQAVALTGLGFAGAFRPLRAQVDIDISLQRLVAANRILANEGVVDAFGHVSIRDPRNPERFIMSRSRSPALVDSSDLMDFTLDGEPVDARGRRPYGERMIHAAVYEARADVNSVVHHHAYAVLPFTITDTPLRPVNHTASVIGASIPVWDVRDGFGETDLLVRDMEMGRALARTLDDNTCLLMRGHGAVVVGPSVRHAVMTAVYLQVNAEIFLDASRLGEPKVLSDAEIELAAATQFSPLGLDRAWEYFCSRAGVDAV